MFEFWQSYTVLEMFHGHSRRLLFHIFMIGLQMILQQSLPCCFKVAKFTAKFNIIVLGLFVVLQLFPGGSFIVAKVTTMTVFLLCCFILTQFATISYTIMLGSDVKGNFVFSWCLVIALVALIFLNCMLWLLVSHKIRFVICIVSTKSTWI